MRILLVFQDISFLSRNRKNINGGGVAFYVKEDLKVKERRDIDRIEPSIEHKWIEISGKNKNSSYFSWMFSINQALMSLIKDSGVKKFDSILGEVHSNWDKPTIVTGDFNIDLLSDSVSKSVYSDTLKTFNLKQHVSKPTRKNKSLIDHISTNLPEKLIHEKCD